MDKHDTAATEDEDEMAFWADEIAEEETDYQICAMRGTLTSRGWPEHPPKFPGTSDKNARPGVDELIADMKALCEQASPFSMMGGLDSRIQKPARRQPIQETTERDT